MWSIVAAAAAVLGFVLGWAGGVSHGRQEVLKDFQSTARQAADTLRQSDPLASSILKAGTDQANAQDLAVQSASHLFKIGMGCVMYANEHHGDGPAKLSDLVAAKDVDDSGVLACPIPGSSYVFLGYHQADPDTAVVAFDKPADPKKARDGINVLYHSGVVKPVAGDEAEKIAAGKQP